MLLFVSEENGSECATCLQGKDELIWDPKQRMISLHREGGQLLWENHDDKTSDGGIQNEAGFCEIATIMAGASPYNLDMKCENLHWGGWKILFEEIPLTAPPKA